MNTIGSRIQFLREKLDITQRELANKIDISFSVMHRIETGERPARDEEIIKIAEALEVTTDFLLGKTDKYFTEGNEEQYIDPDLRAIQRAREKMTPEQKDKMMKVLNAAFDDFFEDK
ncbi:MAG: helix-turn-helix transcriptional regulator [Filifactor alocis]|nr:helix-turn-helix transcriptional regulator [Filifactor alocis]